MFRTLPYFLSSAVFFFLFLTADSDNVARSYVFIFVSALSVFLAFNFRCPRCRLGIDSKVTPGYKIGYTPKDECPRCGRVRSGVWPLQYIFKPERSK